MSDAFETNKNTCLNTKDLERVKKILIEIDELIREEILPLVSKERETKVKVDLTLQRAREVLEVANKGILGSNHLDDFVHSSVQELFVLNLNSERAFKLEKKFHTKLSELLDFT